MAFSSFPRKLTSLKSLNFKKHLHNHLCKKSTTHSQADVQQNVFGSIIPIIEKQCIQSIKASRGKLNEHHFIKFESKLINNCSSCSVTQCKKIYNLNLPYYNQCSCQLSSRLCSCVDSILNSYSVRHFSDKKHPPDDSDLLTCKNAYKKGLLKKTPEDCNKPKNDPCKKYAPKAKGPCDNIVPCKKEEPTKKKESPCKKKEDPCKKKKEVTCKKKEPPKKKETLCKKKKDPCKKSSDMGNGPCDNIIPCKMEEPSKKKESPCKKKEDPCKKKEDPCKKKEDPCKKRKEIPCKKIEPPKKKETPCKKKQDPCKKKKEITCKKKEPPKKNVSPCKKKDPCKKKKVNKCKKKQPPKKENPCKKKDPCEKKKSSCDIPCVEKVLTKNKDRCKKKDPCKKRNPPKKKQSFCKKNNPSKKPCATKKKPSPCKKKDPCKK